MDRLGIPAVKNVVCALRIIDTFSWCELSLPSFSSMVIIDEIMCGFLKFLPFFSFFSKEMKVLTTSDFSVVEKQLFHLTFASHTNTHAS